MTEKDSGNHERPDEIDDKFALDTGRDALILHIGRTSGSAESTDNVLDFQEGRKRLRPRETALDESLQRHPAGKRRPNTPPHPDIIA